ncbi:MAG TPA: D-Ala-D-Ala carboxypeptidase family metallohydrolase [Candidatus Eisenbacteria bacterium]
MRNYRPALSQSFRHFVTAALAALSVTSVAAAPYAPASATPVTPDPLVAPAVNNVPVSITVDEVPGWRQGYTLFVLPGQTITLATRMPDGSAYRWSGDGEFVLPGVARSRAATSGGAGTILPAGSPVVWKAPKGVGGSLLVLRTATADGWVESARIDVQVMAPFEALADGLLAGYRIGRYPAQPKKKTVDQNLADYTHPVGFLKLPEKSAAPIKVSPRFFLHDFVCKQDGEGDRYVALRPELLQMLEAIVDRVESEGFRCSLLDHDGGTVQLASFNEGSSNIAPSAPGRPLLIMSGYRTPAYNRSLGNVKLSRHQFGDASDIIVDSDGDQVMDDLNHDGRLNGQDAITLASWINEIWQTEQFAGRPGGLGVYNAEGEHGPFVHVDMRGVKARWSGNGLRWAEAEDKDAHDTPEPGATAAAPKSTKTKARKNVVR